jgi:hypothetical protein
MSGLTYANLLLLYLSHLPPSSIKLQPMYARASTQTAELKTKTSKKQKLPVSTIFLSAEKSQGHLPHEAPPNGPV